MKKTSRGDNLNLRLVLMVYYINLLLSSLFSTLITSGYCFKRPPKTKGTAVLGYKKI